MKNGEYTVIMGNAVAGVVIGGERPYAVALSTGRGLFCECPSFMFRKALVNGTCKHLRMVIEHVLGLVDAEYQPTGNGQKTMADVR